jgi:hypothetical protein
MHMKQQRNLKSQANGLACGLDEGCVPAPYNAAADLEPRLI